MTDKNYFEILNGIDVNDKVEAKGKFNYLSWAYAWAEIKKRYPESTYTVYESAQGWNYHTDGRTAWVKTGVTVNGIEHVEFLPVMDNNNRSLPLDRITSFEVNKAIQRSLTKAVARHGLGLYIYAGEDLPEATDGATEPKTTTTKQPAAKPAAKKPPEQKPVVPEDIPERKELRDYIHKYGLDGHLISTACGLGPKSTAEDFKKALAYAKKKREEQSRQAYVESLVGGAGNDTQG